MVRSGGVVVVLLNGPDHLGLYRDLLAEAMGADDWLPWPGSTVNVGHEAMFSEVFDDVVLDRFTGTIELDRVRPLVDYAASAREFYDQPAGAPWEEVMGRFEAAAERRLRSDWRLRITTDSGLFVCTVPALR